MFRPLVTVVVVGLSLLSGAAAWGEARSAVDIPTRPGVTQRVIVLAPESPRAAVVLFAGGHGGLQISPSGDIKWGFNGIERDVVAAIAEWITRKP